MAVVLQKLWEVGVIRCSVCDGPLTPLGELTPPAIRDDESEPV
jgi:hypothetical protein